MGWQGHRCKSQGGLPVSVFLLGFLWFTCILQVPSPSVFEWPPLTLWFPTALIFSVMNNFAVCELFPCLRANIWCQSKIVMLPTATSSLALDCLSATLSISQYSWWCLKVLPPTDMEDFNAKASRKKVSILRVAKGELRRMWRGLIYYVWSTSTPDLWKAAVGWVPPPPHTPCQEL